VGLEIFCPWASDFGAGTSGGGGLSGGINAALGG